MTNGELLDLQTFLIDDLPAEVDIEITKPADLFPRLARTPYQLELKTGLDPSIEHLFVIKHIDRRWIISTPLDDNRVLRLVPQREGGSKFVAQTYHQVRTVIIGAVEGRLPWKSYYDLRFK